MFADNSRAISSNLDAKCVTSPESAFNTTDNRKQLGRVSRAIIAPLMPLAAGTKLGPYEIQSPLGAGGMGEVYRARDTRLDRAVAIKILPAHLSCDQVHKQRFERGSQGNFRSESSP